MATYFFIGHNPFMLDNIKRRFSSTPESPSVNDMLETYTAQDLNEHGIEVIRTPQYNNLRVLFYEQYCEFCFKWLEVIDQINLALDVKSQPIRKIDVEGPHPLVQRFEPEGAPTLVIDGVLIRGITTSEFGEGFLHGFLEDELVTK